MNYTRELALVMLGVDVVYIAHLVATFVAQRYYESRM